SPRSSRKPHKGINMKHTSIPILIAVALFAASAQAHENVLLLKNEELGSGTPGGPPLEVAVQVDNDLYHAPQYLPYYPTAAPIWPRVVEVQCTRLPIHHAKPEDARKGAPLKCEGYHWTPAMGRAEYLFVTPKVVEPVAPVVITKEVMVPGPVILKEV